MKIKNAAINNNFILIELQKICITSVMQKGIIKSLVHFLNLKIILNQYYL